MSAHWPWPGDTITVRARKIAWAYRAALEKLDPDEAAALDARFREWGERWPAPVRTYRPDELVTVEEAADLAAVARGTISRMRVRGRIAGVYDKPTRRYFYRVSDVYKLAETVRGRKHNATDTVTDDGRSVSNEHHTPQATADPPPG